jgi:diaminopimelate decarboxylase
MALLGHPAVCPLMRRDGGRYYTKPQASSPFPMSIVRDPSGKLTLGGVPLAKIALETGTPTYVYDIDAMIGEARALAASFEDLTHLVAYAVKANSAGTVIRALSAEGCGADVVSGAELTVALGCGITPDRIVFSGVAKTDAELDQAIGCGSRGIDAVQIESVEEVARVEARAAAGGRPAQVSIRINPGVDLKDATHAHIATGHDAAKFGVSLQDIGRAVQLAEGSPHLRLVGLATHVGSQLSSTEPYVAAARALFHVVRELRAGGRGRSIRFVDSGGGFGVDYTGSRVGQARPGDFVRAARAEQRSAGLDDLALYVEPGRSLVAPHGLLLAHVIQMKVTPAGRWLMIDAGMNDLLRPALYQAFHRVVDVATEVDPATGLAWRVAGPVCESSDDFGVHPLPAMPSDTVAILDAGAYGYTMASQYNGRQLPVEAFVQGGRIIGHTTRASAATWARERTGV